MFHPRIVLAGCPALPDGDEDDAGLIGALRGRGLHARWLAWDDPATLDADLVILRAARDHLDRSAEFTAWTDRVRRLLNPPQAVRWNADARYLEELARRDVPVAPDVEAQTALVFFGAEPSHAFRVAGVECEPDWELWEFGRSTLGVAADHLGLVPTELLSARVDLVGDYRDPRLVTLDLVAPSLGWRHLAADARAARQRQFVLAVETALDRFGLGPLSHRRP